MLATIPAENPLLYKFNPPWTVPILWTTARCSQPAITPQIIPYTPVIGANEVPNRADNATVNPLVELPKPAIYTPIKIGIVFLKCFP